MTRHSHSHRARKHPNRDIIDDIRDNIDNIINGGNQPATITSVIYVTAKPTFSGPIGGYSTATGKDDHPPPTLLPPLEHTPTRSTRRPKPTETSEEEEPTSTPTPTSRSSSSSSSSSSRSSPVTTTSRDRDFTTYTSTPTRTTLTNSNDAAMGTGLNSPSATAAPAAGGMSPGAKAGLAIGLIALFAIIGGAIFFFIRKRKRNEELEEIDNEKSFRNTPMNFPPPPPSRPSVSTTSPVAPKLNIRPVTQFSPDFGRNQPGAAKAPGMLNVSGALPTPPPSTNGSRSLTDGPGPASPLPPPKSHNATNSDPFNDPVNPFDNPNSAPSSPPAERALPGALQMPAANGPPPSPAMSTGSASVVSVAPVPAGGAAGGPPPGPNNVYRIQLDFNPSMDDELSLRAGQLVRMLHEYDDGWALCVRLDQSQQGVAPRTCLSSRPVRPRPRGPPQGPGQRAPGPGPMPPAGGPNSPGPNGSPNPNGPRFNPPANGRPASPNAGYRPYPPPQPKFSEIPRSLSPGPGGSPRIPQPRSMSPGPYGPGGMEKPVMPAAQRPRSNSAGQAAAAPAPAPTTVSSEPAEKPEPTSSPPPSLGPVSRKPIPGQES
ncbi:SH3 domain-containing protein [Arthroderma uncinatum]|uniref:SH3 domain-containing protein n=1 Tax=Arthroderma uncinatum TaxID=74035 RepID=UPI00144ADE55|nr:SH3 domain-containing protein [Arthroderma uncinatum]KAF3491185.1 SH3 domain-containing protein [Arthroderma uncinatum]